MLRAVNVAGKLLVAGALALLLAACAGGDYRLQRFETTAGAYGRALLWADYDAAYTLAGAPEAAAAATVARLRGFRVTGYDVAGISAAADAREVRQRVVIRYVRTDRMIERTVVDEQLWRYDEAGGRWYLLSGLPVLQ